MFFCDEIAASICLQLNFSVVFYNCFFMKLSKPVQQFLITILVCAIPIGLMEFFSLKEKWNFNAVSLFAVFISINFLSIILISIFVKRKTKQ